MDRVSDQWLQKKFMINQSLINWTVVYKKLFLKSFVIGKFKCTCPLKIGFLIIISFFRLQMRISLTLF